MKKLICSLLAAITILIAYNEAYAKQQKRDEIGNTIENLLRPPRVFGLSMSRDGKYVAAAAPVGAEGNRGLVIIDLDTMEVKSTFDLPGRDVHSVKWVTAEDIAFSLLKWGRYADGIFRVNINRKRIQPLLGNDAVVSIVNAVPKHPYSWIRIRSGRGIKPCIARIRINGNGIIRDGGKERIAPTHSNPLIAERIADPEGQVYHWYFDTEKTPRIVLRFHDEKLEYIHRYNKKEAWKRLPLDPEEWDIKVFTDDNDIIYISGYNGKNTKGLYPYNIATNEIGDLIFRDEFYDFSDTVRFVRYKHQIIGFRYIKDTPAFVWISPEMMAIQKKIDAALPNRVNILYSSSEDFSRHLIASHSDTIPTEYFLLDLKQPSLRLITQTAPWLDYDELANTQSFKFKTNDGLQLEGYLTRPEGEEGPHPTICLVHGGPWTRDSGGYHDETQFLASKGYAVLRVNYRGSTGYGFDVSEKPAYDFRKMHDDITEAVKIAIKFGVVDPDRVAIMGASFGGYAALCGAAFEPNLYACAITNMGVFDWEEMIKSRKRQDHRYSYHKLVEKFGNPKKNQEKFEEISPILHVDKIEIPIFIIHGREDSNVSIQQSKMLRSELAEHGVEHEAHYVAGEGHNIFSLKKRVETYEKIVAFLDQHMN